jgi:N-acetylglucosamine-6-phosphate deacetylase
VVILGFYDLQAKGNQNLVAADKCSARTLDKKMNILKNV